MKTTLEKIECVKAALRHGHRLNIGVRGEVVSKLLRVYSAEDILRKMQEPIKSRTDSCAHELAAVLDKAASAVVDAVLTH